MPCSKLEGSSLILKHAGAHGNLSTCCHCEAAPAEAISTQILEIASLRSQ